MEMVDILYFAGLREKLGKSKEKLPLEFSSVDMLLQKLSSRGAIWDSALNNNPNIHIAVNQVISDRHTSIKSGDEIAFFPPVTGG